MGDWTYQISALPLSCIPSSFVGVVCVLVLNLLCSPGRPWVFCPPDPPDSQVAKIPGLSCRAWLFSLSNFGDFFSRHNPEINSLSLCLSVHVFVLRQGSHVTQAGLKFLILLFPPPKYWDPRCVPPCLAPHFLLEKYTSYFFVGRSLLPLEYALKSAPPPPTHLLGLISFSDKNLETLDMVSTWSLALRFLPNTCGTGPQWGRF